MKRLALILFLAFVAIYFFFPIETEDIGLHLATGRWITSHGQVPRVNVFSFTESASPWLHTQWLGSCIYYWVYRLGGEDGLKIFRALFMAAIMVFFLARATKKIPFIPLLLLGLLMARGLSLRTHLRPDLFNLLFIQIFLSVLFAHRLKGGKSLYLLPVLTVLWFNLHGGVVFYGLAVVGIFLGAAVLDLFQERRSSAIRADSNFRQEQTRDLLVVLLGCCLAIFVNPYGLAGGLFPLQCVFPSTGPNMALLDQFTEYLPPVYLLHWQRGWWFYLLAGATILAITRQKKDSFLSLILFVYALGIFIYGTRASSFFVLVSGYILIVCADQGSWAQRWRSWSWSRRGDGLLAVVVILLCLVNSMHLYNRKVIVGDRAQKHMALSYDPYNVVGAAKVLKENHITGNVFNWAMFSGYLLWQGYPQLKPFMDSRNYDRPDDYREYLNIHRNPAEYWPAAEEKYGFNIVLLETSTRFQDKLGIYLVSSGQWQIIFIDGSSVLLVRRGTFALPEGLNQLEKKWSDAKFSVKDIGQEWLAPPPRKNFIREYLDPSPEYVNLVYEGVFLYSWGYRAEGMRRLLSARQKSPTIQTHALFSAVLDDYSKQQQ